MNHPPIVEEPLELVSRVQMSGEERLLVVAHDPDNDPIYFLWPDKPEGAEVQSVPPEAIDGRDWYTSVLRVPYDPALDGRSIDVFVMDGELLERRRWIIEVTE